MTDSCKGNLDRHLHGILFGAFKDLSFENQVIAYMENITMSQRTPESFNGISEADRKNYDRPVYGQCMRQFAPRTPGQERAGALGASGWKSYQAGDIDAAIDQSKQALAVDNTIGWVQSNLGLCYLVKNDPATAMDYYHRAIGNIENSPLQIVTRIRLKAAIDDINNAYVKYPSIQGGPVVAMFETELAKYNFPEPKLFAK